jgi:polysaccharide deacetylase family protein (PEP-CTERM system associated)
MVDTGGGNWGGLAMSISSCGTGDYRGRSETGAASAIRSNDSMRILTFNIEEWFHERHTRDCASSSAWPRYESRIHGNVDRILHLLSARRQPATFFCLGWIARRYPEVIRAIDSMGHEIGAHSFYHRLAYCQSPSDFSEDLRRSIATLSTITGKRVRLYRSPGFSLTHRNPWTLAILADQGIETDCSILPHAHGKRGFKGFGAAEPTLVKYGGCRIKELPVAAARLAGMPVRFSGGGYFRALPYWMIRRLVAKAPYVMSWFHPRDFDPWQPLAPRMSFIDEIRAYTGLHGAFEKLKALLDEFSFCDIRQAEAAVDWSRTRVVTITPNPEFSDATERIGPVRVAPWGSFKVKDGS